MEDFLKLMFIRIKDMNPEADLRQAFEVFDRDQKGTMLVEELKLVME